MKERKIKKISIMSPFFTRSFLARANLWPGGSARIPHWANAIWVTHETEQESGDSPSKLKTKGLSSVEWHPGYSSVDVERTLKWPDWGTVSLPRGDAEMKQEERDVDICVNEYGTDGGRPSSGEKAKKPAKMMALVFRDKKWKFGLGQSSPSPQIWGSD